ncbi:MAG: hypothetical protein ACJ73S_28625, partial [Mycobacteriales bacterium]
WLVTEVAGEYGDACRAVHEGPPERQRRLYRVRARLAGLLAMVFGEAERPRQVDGWLSAADDAAQAAGDPVLGCWVGALTVWAACERGEYVEALEIAEEVIEMAPAGAVLAEAARTLAWAERGQSSEALASLGRADQAYAHLGEDQTGHGVLGYAEVLRHQHRGRVFAVLGMPVLGRYALASAWGCCPVEAVRMRAQIEVDLARCAIQEDGWPAVAPRAEAIIDRLPVEQRTARLARQVRELMGQAERS